MLNNEVSLSLVSASATTQSQTSKWLKASLVFAAGTLGFVGLKWSGALSFLGSWFSGDNSVKGIDKSIALQNIEFDNSQTNLKIAEMQLQQAADALVSAKHERANLADIPLISLGQEFQINTYTYSDQTVPVIAEFLDGKFAVTWYSNGQDEGGWGVYAQIYNADGTQHGAEFRVNTYTDSDQIDPSISSLSDGKFVIVWQSYQDNSTWGIYGKIYDIDGDAYSPEFQINAYTTADQSIPTIAGLSTGGFVVAWCSHVQDEDGSAGVYGQIYDSNGVSSGSEFKINTHTVDDQYFPAVTSLSNGRFVTIWVSNNQDGNARGIYGQLCNGNGTLYGPEFHVNSYTSGDQDYPSVSRLSDEKFVVVWESNGQDGDNWGVYGQIFYDNGTRYNSEFQVNEYTAYDQGVFQEHAVAGSLDGKFIIVWHSNWQDSNYHGVYGKIYHDNGSCYGIEFQINSYSIGEQGYSSAAGLASGNFVVTWQSNGQDGSLGGVYGKIIRFYPPEIRNNTLSIRYKNENVKLTENNLNASCLNTPPNEIVFVPSCVQGGEFQVIPDDGPQDNFTLRQIKGGYVWFAHNGSSVAPSYNITVHVGEFVAGPFAANIEFKGEEPPVSLSYKTIGMIAGIVSGALALAGGTGFFGYQKHKLRESIKLTAIDQKMLVKATALKLLGICDRASDTTIIKDYVASVEQVIDALGQQGIEINFAAGAKSETGIANLAITIAQQIKPYIKRHISCGFFGRKLEKLNTEWIVANIGVIAESIKQDLSRHRHGTKDIQELQVIQTTHTATATIENI